MSNPTPTERDLEMATKYEQGLGKGIGVLAALLAQARSEEREACEGIVRDVGAVALVPENCWTAVNAILRRIRERA
jgi:hypothetical protein